MKMRALKVLLVACAVSMVMGDTSNGTTVAANNDLGTLNPRDCAEPGNARYDNDLADKADIVVSGLAVSMGPGTPACVAAGATSADGSSGPDLLVQEGGQADGGQVLLFWVQCVHKGALVCRRNDADASANPPRCLVAVKVPAQSSETGQLPPCTVTRGYRYTLLLSSKPAADCDGAYNMQSARITDNVRTHVGMQTCAPYPTWPSQDTLTNGTGLAHVLASTCQGATNTKTVKCTGGDDPCTGKAACGEDTAVTCLPKACTGRFMMHNLVTGVDPCQPVFLSKVTGLPVQSCQVTAQRLARQARQAEKRLSTSTTPPTTDSTSQGGASTGQPERLGSVLGGGSRLLPLPSLSSSGGSTSDPAAGDTTKP